MKIYKGADTNYDIRLVLGVPISDFITGGGYSEETHVKCIEDYTS